MGRVVALRWRRGVGMLRGGSDMSGMIALI